MVFAKGRFTLYLKIRNVYVNPTLNYFLYLSRIGPRSNMTHYIDFDYRHL